MRWRAQLIAGSHELLPAFDAVLELAEEERSDAAGEAGPGAAALAAYEDHLQAPLQPLADDLEAATYEVFERDPVKYRLYEEAIHAALLHLTPPGLVCGRLVVMIVGAGRGPILKAALRAARRARLLHMCRFYALDKNPNAIVTLRNLKVPACLPPLPDDAVADSAEVERRAGACGAGGHARLAGA